MVEALGKTHLMKHNEDDHRPSPSPTGHRWPSAALPSLYVKGGVRTEDDLLYMRNLPSFDHHLGPGDAEALLTYPGALPSLAQKPVELQH